MKRQRKFDDSFISKPMKKGNVSMGRGASTTSSDGRWCTSSFDNPAGNAGWGTSYAMPSSSGDHTGNWRTQPAHPSGSGWGRPVSWPASVAPTSETAYQAGPPVSNKYLPNYGNWAPPNMPPSAMGGWDSSMMQRGPGPTEWDPASQFCGAPAYSDHPSYHHRGPPPSRAPASSGGWFSEASFQAPHPPAAAPISAQYGSRVPEPAVGAAAPGMMPPPSVSRADKSRSSAALTETGAAGDTPQKPPAPLTTDTRVVCGALSRLAALPADARRWLVLLARLEAPPAVGGPCRRFSVREPDGTLTECIYYELQRPLPALEAGRWVRCVGRLDARGQFVCVTARPAGRQDIGLHRQLQQIALQAAGDGEQ